MALCTRLNAPTIVAATLPSNAAQLPASTGYGILGGGPGYSGAVYSLTPSGDGSWTETVLHGFNAGEDGGNPVAGVVIRDDGVLYGTTTDGGGKGKFGTVFALKP